MFHFLFHHLVIQHTEEANLPLIREHISFVLNNETIELSDFSSSLTLLDYLRLDRSLRGTKEGCAEGDCGACTVLIGRLEGKELKYESVNACIRFMGSLDGCHVVTVEHLKSSNNKLHPVQQAMVDYHGSQCGFCTPGFVMSIYGLWMQSPNPTIAQIEQALQGNLCRCTGYEPIIKAAQNVSNYAKSADDFLIKERSSIIAKLSNMLDGKRIEVRHGDDLIIIPSDVNDLANARVEYPNSTIVAGSTDVGLWVTKHMRNISPTIFISHLQELRQITKTENGLKIGSCVSYSDMQETIAKNYPQMAQFWNRIGGEQVRNMGTVGGNIANGSPIGDTPPALIALGAEITLRQGSELRTLPLEQFYIEYGKQDRTASDFLESITIPNLNPDDLFAVYKISKRRDEDISALCGAFHLHVEDGLVRDALIVFGGMAGTPKRASAVEQALIGKPWTIDTIYSARQKFEQDFSPLSDWRASAEYRGLTTKNLLTRFFIEMTDSSAQVQLERHTIAEVSQ